MKSYILGAQAASYDYSKLFSLDDLVTILVVCCMLLLLVNGGEEFKLTKEELR